MPLHLALALIFAACAVGMFLGHAVGYAKGLRRGNFAHGRRSGLLYALEVLRKDVSLSQAYRTIQAEDGRWRGGNH